MNYFLKKSTLKAFNKETFDKLSSPGDFNLMTFTEFNKFSNKNKPMTIKEMFAKCLMRVQGVSQDKVLAIVEAFSTPDALVLLRNQLKLSFYL